MKQCIVSHSVEDTLGIGRCIGEGCFSGAVIALWGDLGAGKTALTRGIAQGMGIFHPVSSPTFTIVHQMPGREVLYHMDLYRLQDADEVLQAGLDEMWNSDGVCVIEWPERAAGVLPETRLNITLEHLDGDTRQLTLEPVGAEYQRLAEDIYENCSH